MSPVDTEKQDGPSARTVSALVDDAAERFAAAGIEHAREDAEAIVADALGVEPEELSATVDDVSDEVAADIEAKVKLRVEREPLAYVLGRAPFRDLEIAVDKRVLWPRQETELLVEVGDDKLPRARASTRSAPAPGAIALALMSERPDLVDHRVGPLAGGGRSGARRTPSASASTSTSARSPRACPTTSARSTW